ncbi:hypothetical protein C7S18_22375 [Ahniella affigens]|uniref:DUF3106 domain-containing protein n=1 Tax=Ahniella affigens TaxID=2021234 RepID=A0A2P1PY50_9GAMM|nr:DUF3106 domain-containing protein [Ahniella affigens]AVP99750.1 hypothetical protein C7S18_22375 [Ahniella affigens]
MNARLIQLALLLTLLVSGSVWAAGVTWDELSRDQQQVLLPFADSWNSLPAETQEKLRLGASRWSKMSVEEKQAANQKFGAWRELPDTERQRIRNQYGQFKRMSPEAQQRIRQTFERFQNLPDDERTKLRAKFERMSPRERRAFLEGMRATERARAMQGAMRGLSEADVGRMRAMMSAFTPAQREQVRRLVQRTPQSEHQALRQKLLDMTEAERAAFLDEQVGPVGSGF